MMLLTSGKVPSGSLRFSESSCSTMAGNSSTTALMSCGRWEET